jgi:hypothetical protein
MTRMMLVLAFAPAVLAAQGAPATTTPPPKPEIFFRFPNNGSTVGARFPVVFGMRNYGVAPAGVKVNGTGHFHVIVDTDVPPVGTIIPTDSLNRHFGTGVIETMITLSPGVHTLRLVLGDHEHKVISTDLVSQPIRVTIKP